MESKRPLVGMVGVGARGSGQTRTIQESGSATVVAYADPHGPSRERAAELAPDATPYSDWREMLSKETLDIVVVSTPQHLHREVSLAALQKGLDVYCEKPMAASLEDCDRIVEAVAKASAFFYVGLQLRAMPVMKYAYDLVRDGAIGPARTIAYRELRGPFRPKVDNWHADRFKSGGALVEKNCHHFDLFNWFAESRATRVLGSGGRVIPWEEDGNPGDLLDHAWVLVDYENGAHACLQICFFCRIGLHDFEVIGDSGRISASRTEATLYRKGAEDAPEVKSFGGEDTHGNWAGWLDFMERRATAKGTDESLRRAELGRESVRIALAAQNSIKSGQPVLL